MQDHLGMIDKVRDLMKKMRNTKTRAQCHKHTKLSSLVCNETRWSSLHAMLRRYVELKEHLHQLHVEEIEDLISSGNEHEGIVDLCKTLRSLDSVSKCLQKDSTTIAEFRSLFDAVVLHYQITAARLGPTASIVEIPEFESALVKIKRDTIRDRDDSEKSSVEKLCLGLPQSPQSDQALSLAEIALKSHMSSRPLE